MTGRRRLSYLKGGATLRRAQERCIGCGMRLAVCPQAVFNIMLGRSSEVCCKVAGKPEGGSCC